MPKRGRNVLSINAYSRFTYEYYYFLFENTYAKVVQAERRTKEFTLFYCRCPCGCGERCFRGVAYLAHLRKGTWLFSNSLSPRGERFLLPPTINLNRSTNNHLHRVNLDLIAIGYCYIGVAIKLYLFIYLLLFKNQYIFVVYSCKIDY